MSSRVKNFSLQLFAAFFVMGSVSYAEELDALPLEDLPIEEQAPQEAPYIDVDQTATSIEDEINEVTDQPLPAANAAEVALPAEPSEAIDDSLAPQEFSEAPVAVEATPAEQPTKPQVRRVERGRPLRNETVGKHPLASKGLIRVQRDGSYIYRTSTGVKSQSASFRIGHIQAPKIQSADGQTDFESMYGTTGVSSVSFDYEWQPFTGWGKLGVMAGAGLFTASGAGRFLDGTEAKEEYTFVGLPLSGGGVYRLELSDRQWLAPYIMGGLSYYILGELRDDSKSPNFVGTFAGYGGGGLLFSITQWDRETAHVMWGEYGIANMWVSTELRVVQAFEKDLDVSSTSLNVGLTFDF